MITTVKGNLLDASEDIIAHQVNCMGVMRAGLAQQIKDKWPEAYNTYLELVEGTPERSSLMGETLTVKVEKRKYVMNIFGQYTYGKIMDHTGYTDYDALEKGLIALRTIAEENGKSVALPHGIGCGKAGGNWRMVMDIIEDAFDGYDVTLYKQ